MALRSIEGGGGVRPHAEEIQRYHEAAQEGRLAEVRAFASQYPNKVDVPYGGDESTALIAAAHRHADPLQRNAPAYDEIVAFLLKETNANPGMRTKSNITALQGATRTGNIYTARLIIDALKERYERDPKKLLEALTLAGPDGKTPEVLAKTEGRIFGIGSHLEYDVKELRQRLGMDPDGHGSSGRF